MQYVLPPLRYCHLPVYILQGCDNREPGLNLIIQFRFGLCSSLACHENRGSLPAQNCRRLIRGIGYLCYADCGIARGGKFLGLRIYSYNQNAWTTPLVVCPIRDDQYGFATAENIRYLTVYAGT